MRHRRAAEVAAFLALATTRESLAQQAAEPSRAGSDDAGLSPPVLTTRVEAIYPD